MAGAAFVASAVVSGCGSGDAQEAAPTGTGAGSSSTTASTSTSSTSLVSISPSVETTEATTPAPAPVPQSCDDIVFEANSDNIASDIVATGVSCAEADTFIRAADGQAPRGESSYPLNGFDCTVVQATTGLAHAIITCTTGNQTISYRRF